MLRFLQSFLTVHMLRFLHISSVDTVKGGAHVKKEEVEITVNSRNRFLKKIFNSENVLGSTPACLIGGL